MKSRYIHSGPIILVLLFMAWMSCAGPAPQEKTAGTVKSVGDTGWIDPNEIQKGPILHEELAPELIERIKAVQIAFQEVDDSPLEAWIDDFQRDLDPEENLRIWEDMQQAYEGYCDPLNPPLATRKEVFRVVLMRSMVPESEVLDQLELQHLSTEEAQAVMAGYKASPKPITVIGQ